MSYGFSPLRSSAADGPADRRTGSSAALSVGLLPRRSRISLGGYDFACMEEGSGEALLFIHGSLGTLLEFTPAVRHFARKYRAIAYSRRYHPPNSVDPREAEYTIPRHAEDLMGLLSALRIEPAHLVGSSWGAYVALFLATRHPHATRSIILGEPPVLPLLRRSPEGLDLLNRFLRETVTPSLTAFRRGSAIDGVRTFFDGVTGRSGAFDALTDATRQALLLSGEELRREFETPFDAYMPDLTLESLGSLTCPVLLLESERSPQLFHRILDELEAAIPRAERVVLPGTGHAMHTGNPDAYMRAIEHFLDRHSGDPMSPGAGAPEEL